MALLHDLQKRFSGEFSFACTWWRFRYLSDSDIALVARHYAIAADIVIFSSASAGLLPLAVMNWVESWISGRRRAGGVLVPLIGSPNLPPQLYATKLFYLREVAERAHMDYLPQTLLVQSRGNRAANVIGTPTAHFDQ
ncbi:MAG TPA: hypothetical protein DCY13_01980 [Verrucomicrobiales bacterium]|nr:hypothetical protein [Verrucomicrobiales bacterium]